MDPKHMEYACAGLLTLQILATSVILNLKIPVQSAWSLLQPFTLIVAFSAVVHLPKQGRCIVKAAEKARGCPTAAGHVVLAGMAVSAVLTIAWTSQQLYNEQHKIKKAIKPKHGMLLAALVLQLLVLVGVLVVGLRIRLKK